MAATAETYTYVYGDYYIRDDNKTIFYDGTKWAEWKFDGFPIGGKVVSPPANIELLTIVGEGIEQAQANATIAASAAVKPLATTYNSGSKRYPGDIDYAGADYMIFEFFNYTPPFGSVGNKTRSAEISLVNYNFGASRETLEPAGFPQIVLYMPEGVSASYKANWDGKKFGNIAAGVLAASGGFAGGDFGKFFQNLGSTATAATERAGAQLGSSAVSAIIQGITGESVGVSDVFSSVGGQILNPNAELIFGGHDLRTFTFSYRLVPFNQPEAEIIFGKGGIIETFKKAMLPSFAGLVKPDPGEEFTKSDKGKNKSIGFIKNPKIVQPYFMNGNAAHPYLPKLKPCTITDFDVNYTADGVYAAHAKGYPAAAEITISLIETKLIYAEDIENGF